MRSVRGEEIPVIASIEGTLYAPKLRLESTLRPPISETDLVSYLITGYPANEATRDRQRQRAGDRPGLSLQRALAASSSAR